MTIAHPIRWHRKWADFVDANFESEYDLEKCDFYRCIPGTIVVGRGLASPEPDVATAGAGRARRRPRVFPSPTADGAGHSAASTNSSDARPANRIRLRNVPITKWLWFGTDNVAVYPSRTKILWLPLCLTFSQPSDSKAFTSRVRPTLATAPLRQHLNLLCFKGQRQTSLGTYREAAKRKRCHKRCLISQSSEEGEPAL
jgi:hypothetical protein